MVFQEKIIMNNYKKILTIFMKFRRHYICIFVIYYKSINFNGEGRGWKKSGFGHLRKFMKVSLF